METPSHLASPFLSRSEASVVEYPDFPSYLPYGAYIPPEPSAPPADCWPHSLREVGLETKHDDELVPAPDAGVFVGQPVPEIIEHVVSQADTLQGLLLRYNITLRELKKWNQFPRENFKILRKLKIPLVKGARPVEARTEEEIVYDFSRTTGITRSEAKYYLGEHGFDVEQARAALKGDVSWEAAQKHERPVKAEAGEALRRRLKAF